ncbi:hypothetical protein SORBI_3001G019500 [Sorghum bicolor]|nr:hypothetical protein SORBI_3001G019500 [Sorghum bicolor]
MALDESFKRPGTVPFKWEVQPGIPIPKQQQEPAGDVPPPAPATSPRLALPPAARVVGAPCRRASSSVPLSPPAPQPSHRRSMSARFATSLALMPLPFTRRGRGGRAKDDAAQFCLL